MKCNIKLISVSRDEEPVASVTLEQFRPITMALKRGTKQNLRLCVKLLRVSTCQLTRLSVQSAAAVGFHVNVWIYINDCGSRVRAFTFD